MNLQLGIHTALMFPSALYVPSWYPLTVLTALPLLFLDTYSGNLCSDVLKRFVDVVYDTVPEKLVFRRDFYASIYFCRSKFWTNFKSKRRLVHSFIGFTYYSKILYIFWNLVSNILNVIDL